MLDAVKIRYLIFYFLYPFYILSKVGKQNTPSHAAAPPVSHQSKSLITTDEAPSTTRINVRTHARWTNHPLRVIAHVSQSRQQGRDVRGPHPSALCLSAAVRSH